MKTDPNLPKMQPPAGGPIATPQNQTSVGNAQGAPGQRGLRADPQRVVAELPRPEKAKSVLSRLAAGFKSLTQTNAQPMAAAPRRVSGAAENTKSSSISVMERFLSLQPSNKFPAPNWVAGKDISIDPSGLMMFDKAGRDVMLTGVMNVQTGKISLTAVMPRNVLVEHDIGGFKGGTGKGKDGVTREGMVAPESGEFVESAMPPPKAMKLLGVKELQPIDHQNVNYIQSDAAKKATGSSPRNPGTSHEQLIKDAEGIRRDVGRGNQVPEKSNYIGFTITKGEGSKEWPHEILFRSGTLNDRFVKGGVAIPSDWADMIATAMEQLLPNQPTQTRERGVVRYQRDEELGSPQSPDAHAAPVSDQQPADPVAFDIDVNAVQGNAANIKALFAEVGLVPDYAEINGNAKAAPSDQVEQTPGLPVSNNAQADAKGLDQIPSGNTAELRRRFEQQPPG